MADTPTYKYLDYVGLNTLIGHLNNKFTDFDTKFENWVKVKPIVEGIGEKGYDGLIGTITVGETEYSLYGDIDSNTQYTFEDGENGSFTVTPSDKFGNAEKPQTVSIGKPNKAYQADRLSTGDVGATDTPVYFDDGVPVICEQVATSKDISDLKTLINDKVASVFKFHGVWVPRSGEPVPGVAPTGVGSAWRLKFEEGSPEVVIGGTTCETGDIIVWVGNGNGDSAGGYDGWTVIQNNIDLKGIDATVSAEVGFDTDELSMDCFAVLSSITQTDARLASGDSVVFASISTEEIAEMWGEYDYDCDCDGCDCDGSW